ncbi:hypothetical protein, variant 1 [Aphanomyces invadans]|uniref:PIPK domain-containing protein n=1 Tax=Aphanomyces invadans TaxID=157072 RepID=A0A024TQ05_9STRA|nr:hypothetical protein, variant 1 [Aphanomyces invadans]ETV95711.1 hypothetical protein, variant 1 [Aphanomyces invadans]|eukprot:XP_008875904.1 hypothetical protein, variant 1 [Aphanomyces invadans]
MESMEGSTPMDDHLEDHSDRAVSVGAAMERQVCGTDSVSPTVDSCTCRGEAKSASITSFIDINDVLDDSFDASRSDVEPTATTSTTTSSGAHSALDNSGTSAVGDTMDTGSTDTTTATSTATNASSSCSFAYLAHTEPETPLDGIVIHPNDVPARKASSARKVVSGELVSAPGRQTRRRGMKELYLLLCDNGKLLGGKTVMAVSTALFSVALVICVVALRSKTRQVVKMPSGVLLGSLGTLIMSCVVLTSYLLSPGCRRHSNILLLNRSIMDLLLALSFLLQPAWNNWNEGSEVGTSCQYVSAIREYFIMTSAAWEFCMAIDLFSLLNDPFTSPRKNRGRYQLFSHGLGLLGGGVMLTSSSFYGTSVGDFCWVKSSGLDQGHFFVFDAGVWIFIAVPVLCFLSTNIYVCAVSAKRFRSGIEATLEHRRGLLREGFFTTVAYIVYWLLLWGVYVAFWLTKPDGGILPELFGFLLSFRGSVVFALWILYSSPTGHDGRERTIQDRDDAMRAQTNYALLKELVFYTTRGITKAVQVANKRQALELPEVSIFTVHPPHNEHSLFSCHECKFTDMRPDVFCHVREYFGVDDRDFIDAFANCSIPKVSEGASGSFMFFTTNGAYIVKSVTRRESLFLRSIVDKYAAYVYANPGTFLTRILGTYSMVLYGRETCFVVMENLFDKHHAVHHRYDIKGSWIDRNAEKARRGQECTCRYCNMTFRTGNRDSCPNRAGFHEPNVVLKDMDLTTKVMDISTMWR